MGAQLIVAIENATVKQTETMCKTSSSTLFEDFVVGLEADTENPEQRVVPPSHITIGQDGSLAIPCHALMTEHIKELLDNEYASLVPFKYNLSNIDKKLVIEHLTTSAWRVAIRQLKARSRHDVFEVTEMVIVSDDSAWKQVVEDRLRAAQEAFLKSEQNRKVKWWKDFVRLHICLWVPNRVPSQWKMAPARKKRKSSQKGKALQQ